MMSTKPGGRLRGVAATGFLAVLLALGLAACGPVGPGTDDGGSTGHGGPGDAPSASDQTVSEACLIGKAQVDDALADAQGELEKIQSSVLSGEFPDLQSFADMVGENIDKATAQVTNDEVRALLGEVHDAIAGLGEIETPGSLLDAPSYASSVASQLEQLRAVAGELQVLCSEG